ncbi:MAG: divalent-cation tolerance protein CutA [Candidatus Eremiobacteraeota bacterium]|nr:divalent-cation tolerance protein CutA [Candidatus Eremiobacteraeota bacterium]
MRIIISTCKPDEADMISDTLLEERLIASCNIVPNITTKVRWKGEAVTQTETLLIMRTRAELMWKLERRLVELNSFEVPEVASFEIKEWNARYFNWLYGATKDPKE